MTLHVAYIGNFTPPHSTENHVAFAWEVEGHTLTKVQEEDDAAWRALIADVSTYDLILWTSTGGLAVKLGTRRQWEMIAAAKSAGVPTVAFHLDRWWYLNREAEVWERPFFRCEFVITADGGHQDEFRSVGVNHVWLPPAVHRPETELGVKTAKFQSNLAFVGSWRPGYHAEWTHRPQLINWLAGHYRDQIEFWPKVGELAVRGKDLQDLYASVDIVIGDSCLSAPSGFAERYFSDRIPETVGRGGFLLHPYVVGIEEHFTPGEHLVTWNVGDFKDLSRKIDKYLANIQESRRIATAGRAHVIEHHTYNNRVAQIIEIVG